MVRLLIQAVKKDAIVRDASQVPVIYRFTQDFRGAVSAFAQEVGGNSARPSASAGQIMRRHGNRSPWCKVSSA